VLKITGERGLLCDTGKNPVSTKKVIEIKQVILGEAAPFDTLE